MERLPWGEPGRKPQRCRRCSCASHAAAPLSRPSRRRARRCCRPLLLSFRMQHDLRACSQVTKLSHVISFKFAVLLSPCMSNIQNMQGLNMAEPRKRQRVRTMLGAQIIFKQSQFHDRCQVRNMTDDGAKIIVDSQLTFRSASNSMCRRRPYLSGEGHLAPGE